MIYSAILNCKNGETIRNCKSNKEGYISAYWFIHHLQKSNAMTIMCTKNFSEKRDIRKTGIRGNVAQLDNRYVLLMFYNGLNFSPS